MIKSWADEYDSDMDDEWKPNSQSLNNSNSIYDRSIYDKDTFYKFSDKICERKCTINYNLFSIVENSRYSCLMPWYVSQVNFFLKDIYIKPNISVNKIVDSGANIGVDSINFLINFPRSQLIAFEIENKTYNALCNNLLEYKSVTRVNSKEELILHNSKVQAYNKDFLLNFELIYNSDIVFIDAPWGGSIYKDKKNISIYLHPENDYYNINDYDSSKNIITITKKILDKKYNVKSVMLKVPYNYEFDNFEKELNSFNSNIVIKYKKIYKGNTTYIAFVLIAVYIKN
jgi:hypothetical protein